MDDHDLVLCRRLGDDWGSPIFGTPPCGTIEMDYIYFYIPFFPSHVYLAGKHLEADWQ